MNFPSRKLLFFRCPINVIVHRHEYDAVLDIQRLDSKLFLHQFLDLVEKLRCRVPWENLPLEYKRFTIKIVPFKVFPDSPPRHSTESENTDTFAVNCL